MNGQIENIISPPSPGTWRRDKKDRIANELQHSGNSADRSHGGIDTGATWIVYVYTVYVKKLIPKIPPS